MIRVLMLSAHRFNKTKKNLNKRRTSSARKLCTQWNFHSSLRFCNQLMWAHTVKRNSVKICDCQLFLVSFIHFFFFFHSLSHVILIFMTHASFNTDSFEWHSFQDRINCNIFPNHKINLENNCTILTIL